MSEAKKYLLVSPAGYGAADRFEFTYHFNRDLPVGTLVKIPLLRRSVWGVVTGTDSKPSFKTKAISIPSLLITLPSPLIELARWMFDYYLASPAAIWQSILPAGLDKPPKSQRPSYDFPKVNWPHQELSQDQKSALKTAQSQPGPFLLHGVTGSGKTQIYLELSKQAVESGKSAIILVPEIALTPQIIARFHEVFGDKVISRHSRMTPAQKFLNWQEILESKDPKVIIGPRSCLFLPVKNLGLIAIDECHETTYKSEQSPRYQADAVAAKLASLHGAKLILGSATPSLGQIFLAQNQRLNLLEMKKRAGGQTLPTGTIVDLRLKTGAKSAYISTELKEALAETLAAGRQSLLFINRRGSATTHICSECGYVSKCPNCHLPATFHGDKLKLVCHHCGWQEAPPSVCPDCGQQAFKYLGGGTQRIEAEVKSMFPEARISRLDKDTATAKFVHQTHADLHEGKTDILIGTQMIAKGLNLPLMDAVGIVLADSMLYLPDFTAAERTFQLISQVSGRTGRAGQPGKVIIQTYSPEHPAITAAAEGNFEGFTKAEMEQRKLLKYPPFTYLLKVTVAAKTAEKAASDLAKLAKALQGQKLGVEPLTILGPAPAYHEQFGGKFHWQLIIKSPRRAALTAAAKIVPNSYTIDLDPINLL